MKEEEKFKLKDSNETCRHMMGVESRVTTASPPRRRRMDASCLGGERDSMEPYCPGHQQLEGSREGDHPDS